MRKLGLLGLSDAVLGTEAAPELVDDVVNDAIYVGRRAVTRIFPATAWDKRVVVKVPVAEVPETNDPRARKMLLERARCR